jgi:hypothetical protein
MQGLNLSIFTHHLKNDRVLVIFVLSPGNETLTRYQGRLKID